mmetsp:Transcript_43265/g.109262  ORF Transcript_43265/g.109262 Transcript_43265/m.109262 type:complete len:361 (-) Transcript_43265:73-1155(-)
MCGWSSCPTPKSSWVPSRKAGLPPGESSTSAAVSLPISSRSTSVQCSSGSPLMSTLPMIRRGGSAPVGEFLERASVAPRTLEEYRREVRKFLAWVRRKGVRSAPGAGSMDDLVLAYIGEVYDGSRSRKYYSSMGKLLAGLQLMARIPLPFVRCKRALRGWNRLHPLTPKYPVTRVFTYALAARLLAKGRPRLAYLYVLMFHAKLRISEAVQMVATGTPTATAGGLCAPRRGCGLCGCPAAQDQDGPQPSCSGAGSCGHRGTAAAEGTADRQGLEVALALCVQQHSAGHGAGTGCQPPADLPLLPAGRRAGRLHGRRASGHHHAPWTLVRPQVAERLPGALPVPDRAVPALCPPFDGRLCA